MFGYKLTGNNFVVEEASGNKGNLFLRLLEESGLNYEMSDSASMQSEVDDFEDDQSGKIQILYPESQTKCNSGVGFGNETAIDQLIDSEPRFAEAYVKEKREDNLVDFYSELV